MKLALSIVIILFLTGLTWITEAAGQTEDASKVIRQAVEMIDRELKKTKEGAKVMAKGMCRKILKGIEKAAQYLEPQVKGAANIVRESQLAPDTVVKVHKRLVERYHLLKRKFHDRAKNCEK